MRGLYRNTLEFYNERTEVIEGEFGDWKIKYIFKIIYKGYTN